VVVGDDVDSEKASSYGAAHVFRWSGSQWRYWKLYPENLPYSSPSFGATIAADGDMIAVGTDYGATSYGIAFVYELEGNTWNETPIEPVNPETHSRFGRSLDISGDVLVAGDPGNGVNNGRAYVFRKGEDGWNEEAILTPPSPELDYGLKVAVSGNRILVRSRGVVDPAVIYLYEWDGTSWQQSILNPPDNLADSLYFGSQFAIDGDTIAVSDHFGQGSVIIYRWDGAGWNISKVQPSDSALQDFFDFRSLAGNRLTAKSKTGAYVFTWDGASWNEEKVREGIPDGASQAEYYPFVSTDPELTVIGHSIFPTDHPDALQVHVINPNVDPNEPPPDPVPPELWPTSEIKRLGDAFQVDIFRQPDTDSVLALPMQSPNLHDWAQVPQAPVQMEAEPDSDVEHWRTIIPIEPDSGDTFIRVLTQE
jgi:hypothetical protein